MWRDVSKSALIFGIGTFITISSSYTQDLNISFITVISYVGLVYLAAIFLYRSIICRGIVDIDESSCVVGEEEAIWVLKLVLPYLNEFLLKLRALFSGDPSTTMKLAVLLFVLARCGSSITIWKMAKLGFFGVFTVPKVCCSYSHQITAYGTFWIRRFRDAWASCTHKKAVAVAIFTLVWNLSSIVARIWAAFMLFVAFRYYQQRTAMEEWAEAETEPSDTNESWKGTVGRQRQHGYGPPRMMVPNKLKKRS
ncbi:Reticulon-like protein B21 [Hibiscus syriacus]|uniref:Reticulon-like protein n=2 Tax=Hibiscus syriacus TaxID=106335 RepID=A0A6A2ZBZ8_HIBSY|nr:Reticulon-like protein B21 [Hibiscus syriacus]